MHLYFSFAKLNNSAQGLCEYMEIHGDKPCILDTNPGAVYRVVDRVFVDKSRVPFRGIKVRVS